jgi:hypothetical protein
MLELPRTITFDEYDAELLNEYVRDVQRAFEQVQDREEYRTLEVDGGDTELEIGSERPVLAIELAGVFEQGAPETAPSSLPGLHWRPSDEGAIVTQFYNLSSGTKYDVRLRIVRGV